MNIKVLKVIFLLILLIVIALSIIYGCTKQVVKYEVTSDMMGLTEPMKIKVNSFQAWNINHKMKMYGCQEITYKKDTMYIYIYHYYCAEELFENGLIPNSVLKKYKQSHKLEFEWDENE